MNLRSMNLLRIHDIHQLVVQSLVESSLKNMQEQKLIKEVKPKINHIYYNKRSLLFNVLSL
jgi:hypothetical protein